MTKPKYELVPGVFYVRVRLFEQHKLRRIRALKDFGDVKKGDIGGYVESQYNLSHEGNCWIYDDAMSVGRARVLGNAKMHGSTQAYDEAVLADSAEVFDRVRIFGRAMVCQDAVLKGAARCYGDSVVTETTTTH